MRQSRECSCFIPEACGHLTTGEDGTDRVHRREVCAFNHTVLEVSVWRRCTMDDSFVGEEFLNDLRSVLSSLVRV